MEAAAAMFMLIAVSGNQQGPITFNELARFPTEEACLTAAKAMTVAVTTGGTLAVDGLACMAMANLKAVGATLIRP